MRFNVADFPVELFHDPLRQIKTEPMAHILLHPVYDQLTNRRFKERIEYFIDILLFYANTVVDDSTRELAVGPVVIVLDHDFD